MMERSGPLLDKGPVGFGQRSWLTGSHMATLFPCSIVDASGKEVPWVNAKGEYVPPDKRAYPVNVPDQKLFLAGGGSGGIGPKPPELQGVTPVPQFLSAIMQGVKPEGFTPPFYADLPSMSDYERRVIFGLMVGQEGRTSLGYRDLTSGGFDPDKDMLQVYFGSRMPSGFRGLMVGPNGGMIPDWDLRGNLEGLYGAGRFLMAGEDCFQCRSHRKVCGQKSGGLCNVR